MSRILRSCALFVGCFALLALAMAVTSLLFSVNAIEGLTTSMSLFISAFGWLFAILFWMAALVVDDMANLSGKDGNLSTDGARKAIPTE